VIKAEFYDCIWESMNGPNTIQVESPIALDLHTARVQNGFGTSFFRNGVGSTFNLEDVTAQNLNGNSLIRTTGTGSVTNFYLGDISDSDLVRIAYTDGGGEITLSRMNVYGMNSLDFAFYSSGANTRMNISDFSIRDNIETEEWNGVVGTGGSTVTVTGGNFLRNTDLNFGCGARDGSTVTVTDTIYDSNTGIPGQSSLIHTDGGTITGESLNMVNNTRFVGHFFAIHNGHMNIHSNCIESGRSNALAFVSRDSTYEMTNDNYINNLVVSDICTEINNIGFRLAYEERDDPTVRTDCFTTQFCETDCLQFGSLGSCRGTAFPTTAPLPTISPRPTTKQTARPVYSIVAPTPFPVSQPTYRPTRIPQDVMGQVPSGGLIPDNNGAAVESSDLTPAGAPAGGNGSSAFSSHYYYYHVFLLLSLQIVFVLWL